MKINEGMFDRSARTILGLALVAWGFWAHNSLGIIAVIVGQIPFLTGLIGWCPIYQVLGLSNDSRRKNA
ncbi:PF11127 family protein [Leptospira inadai serovar Lyme str. 10]|uniref:PF11127 family protein n=2 Tax=Leptospira inadai serovar Lyme TaxID=293084 RepID=V6HFS6_9LEPT|nr:DUF2892 domain-containing protein [Leptospira inadai]EQA38708.1 PF11127 family protein [Leptospira inadai serovar Lyme str. 10]PNV72846.1 DUF2892 domain-containing protein [Leptospira inadai serovar Lyme]